MMSHLVSMRHQREHSSPHLMQHIWEGWRTINPDPATPPGLQRWSKLSQQRELQSFTPGHQELEGGNGLTDHLNQQDTITDEVRFWHVWLTQETTIHLPCTWNEDGTQCWGYFPGWWERTTLEVWKLHALRLEEKAVQCEVIRPQEDGKVRTQVKVSSGDNPRERVSKYFSFERSAEIHYI